jgi:hypothetical protein
MNVVSMFRPVMAEQVVSLLEEKPMSTEEDLTVVTVAAVVTYGW